MCTMIDLDVFEIFITYLCEINCICGWQHDIYNSIRYQSPGCQRNVPPQSPPPPLKLLCTHT